jgi:hypothetical protein
MNWKANKIKHCPDHNLAEKYITQTSIETILLLGVTQKQRKAWSAIPETEDEQTQPDAANH